MSLPYYVEELSGEVVNDAVFNRNLQLMETYDFALDVRMTSSDYSAHFQELQKLTKAGDDAYDLMYVHCVGGPNMAVAGLLRDLYEVPYLDFSRPWWPRQTVKEMTVYGRIFTVCSSIDAAQLSASEVFFINKDAYDDLGIEYPYRRVREGSWTLDAMISDTKGVYRDLNGNGERDKSDFYGYTSTCAQGSYLIACNTPVLSPTEDGGREITVLSERLVKLTEKIYDWYYVSGDVNLEPALPFSQNQDFFADGKAAAAFSHLSATSQYRTGEIRYGILPMPKYDEGQTDYYISTTPSLFAIPKTAADTAFAGFVFEAMTYAGYYDIIPAYYGITLKGKIADSPDDVEMLELINANLTTPFAYCYDNWEGFAHFLNMIMGFTKKEGSKDVASAYAQHRKVAEKRLNKVLSAFSEYEG